MEQNCPFSLYYTLKSQSTIKLCDKIFTLQLKSIMRMLYYKVNDTGAELVPTGYGIPKLAIG